MHTFLPVFSSYYIEEKFQGGNTMKRTNNLSSNLINYRNKRGISNREFAKEIDISESTLRTIIERNGNTSLHTLLSISENMNVSLDELVVGKTMSDHMMILDLIERSTILTAALTPEQKAEVARLAKALCDVLFR